MEAETQPEETKNEGSWYIWGIAAAVLIVVIVLLFMWNRSAFIGEQTTTDTQHDWNLRKEISLLQVMQKDIENRLAKNAQY